MFLCYFRSPGHNRKPRTSTFGGVSTFTCSFTSVCVLIFQHYKCTHTHTHTHPHPPHTHTHTGLVSHWISTIWVFLRTKRNNVPLNFQNFTPDTKISHHAHNKKLKLFKANLHLMPLECLATRQRFPVPTQQHAWPTYITGIQVMKNYLHVSLSTVINFSSGQFESHNKAANSLITRLQINHSF